MSRELPTTKAKQRVLLDEVLGQLRAATRCDRARTGALT